MVDDVLRARSHPRIEFVSTSVVAEADGGYRVAGALSLAGVTRDVVASVRREGDRLRTEVEIDQPSFGIRPFVGLFGAIRVKPRVVVHIAVPAPGA